MTREEAIKILCEPGRIVCNVIKANDADTCEYNAQSLEALQMALQALSAEPFRDIEEIREVISCDADAETKCKMISNILTAKPHYFKQQEPCDDCISRQATLEKFQKTYFDNQTVIRCAELVLEGMPPVTPQPKMGRWIKVSPWTKPYCSECGESCIGVHGFDCITTDFCPHCGAKMQPEGEE